MTKTIQLISPVDGQVYAERPALSLEAAQAAAARAKAAQTAWAARPLDERIALVKAGVAELNEMKDVMVEELAWQMGRPIRYGGEFGGVNDRTNYMSEIAAEALAPMVAEDSDRFERRIAREPRGRGLRRRAVELSLPDHDQHPRPGADRGQRGDPEARDARRCWWASVWPRPSTRPACPRTCSRTSCWTTPRPRR